jgi:hypothetical protein
MKMVLITDHGRMFGHPHWYTFNCPKCHSQVERWKNETECECGQELQWKNDSEPGSAATEPETVG